MNNAPWHIADDIKHVIESTDAKLIRLPPYSPDLNKIEQVWANLKVALKKAASAIPDIHLNPATQI
jgi:transposase